MRMSRIRFAIAAVGTVVFGLGLALTPIFIIVAVIQYMEEGSVAWAMPSARCRRYTLVGRSCDSAVRDCLT